MRILVLIALSACQAAHAVRRVPAPLASAECAQFLLDQPASAEVEAVGRLTREEVDVLVAVAVEAPAIRRFFAEIFPSLVVRNDEMTPSFRALWRRLPELRAPEFAGGAWRDAAVERAWEDYRLALRKVSIEPGAYRPLDGLLIKSRATLRGRLREADPELLRQIYDVPFDADLVLDFLLQLFDKSPIRANGWLDVRLNLLWQRVLGVKRPWVIVRAPDAFALRRESSPLARRRLVDEWRLLLMVINRNLPR